VAHWLDSKAGVHLEQLLLKFDTPDRWLSKL